MKYSSHRIRFSLKFLITFLLLSLFFLKLSNTDKTHATITYPNTKKALLIVYNPVLSNGQTIHQYYDWGDPIAKNQEVLDHLRESSHGYASYQIVESYTRNEFPRKIDGFRYNSDSYMACISNNSLCHAADDADYNQVWKDFNICEKVSSGKIDEIIIWGAPNFGFDEFAIKIPGDKYPYAQPTNYWLYEGRKKNIPDCNNKTVVVMGYLAEAGVPNAVHSYGHRMESFLGLTVGRGQVKGEGCRGVTDWDRFTCIKKDISSSTPIQVSGCGNIHYPPNGTQDYEYDNTTNTPTTCENWTGYPTIGSTKVQNCLAWSCSDISYYKWWMKNLPHQSGTTSNGNLRNWWRYVVDYDSAIKEIRDAFPTPSPIISPTPIFTPIPTYNPLPGTSPAPISGEDPKVSLTPLYRFWSSNYQSHFYTINEAEKDITISTNPNWKFEGIAFYVTNFSYGACPGSYSPVYRFWNTEAKHHFYTINEEEKNHILKYDPKWELEGVGFCALQSSVSKAAPVYRFYSYEKKTHFYTINAAERDHVITTDPSWIFEGTGYFAYKNL